MKFIWDTTACLVFQAAGQKKLRAMKAACSFRRGIVFQEWEHQKVRMQIEDKDNELKTIESVKVWLAADVIYSHTQKKQQCIWLLNST